MRRLSLSTKLFAATLPLLLAVAGLLALTVRSDLSDIREAESGAELGSVWTPLIAALDAVEAESAALAAATAPAVDPSSTMTASADAEPTGPDAAIAADPALRRTTDGAINELRDAIEVLNAFEAASQHVTTGRSALSAARRTIDMAVIAPQMTADVDPAEAYGTASRELVAVGQLLPPEAGDAQLGSELLAVVKLAEAKLHANDVIAATSQWPNPSRDNTPLVQARAAFATMTSTLGEFEAIAPEEWATQYRQSGFTTALGGFRTGLDSVARAADAGRIETFDTASFSDFTEQGVGFQRSISQSIVDRATADADTTRSATLVRTGIILGAVLLAGIIAWLISRSITRRVKAVAHSANRVASEQLPALVEALRDPRGKAMLPDIAPVSAKGSDDLADLAHAFNSMQATLIDVAHEQVEVLRRGVSDIFITMARRNRSLIDRQLAMLDEYEASVDDHEVLANYYQLDHLATRMRRNSESLLVLANAEPKRRRVKATEIDDVVRASIGEVEDYRRVEVQHLESLQVRGTVVADISHLLAELLDNATSFSPPDSLVRVGGRRAGDSYMLRIIDDGVGIGPDRLKELNELLRDPPVVGLSVESTLGISVVSLLANKHGIEVTLSAGNPGLTVDVVLPGSLFGPIDAPAQPAPSLPTEASYADAPSAPTVPVEQVVAWNDQPDRADDPRFEPASPLVAEPASPLVAETAVPALAPEPSLVVAANDWTSMSLDMSSFEASAAESESAPAAPAAGRAERPLTLPTDAADDTNSEHTISDDVSSDEVSSGEVSSGEVSSGEVSSGDVSTDFASPAAGAAATAEAPPTPALPTRPQGEFDQPLAPPVGTGGLTHRPFTPESTRQYPAVSPTPPAAQSLPTRTQRGTGPEGPDRLADPTGAPTGNESPVATSEPSALQAALSAFDTGRNAVGAAPGGDLPTRTRVGDPVPHIDGPSAVTQSRIDPAALRDRLRAFKSEFTSAGDGGPDIYSDDLNSDDRNSDDRNDSTTDHEGLPR